eukprot:2885335-Pyramimonas_sp.AAC.1
MFESPSPCDWLPSTAMFESPRRLRVEYVAGSGRKPGGRVVYIAARAGLNSQGAGAHSQAAE